MARYNNANITKNNTGKRKIGTWIISAAPSSSDDLVIQITSTDRLDILAAKLYGDQRLWYIIAAANGLGKGTLLVPADTILRIPSKNLATSFINLLNTQR